jgi:hypothetical protein
LTDGELERIIDEHTLCEGDRSRDPGALKRTRDD